MIYSDEFLDSLPTDAVEAGKLLCKLFYEFEESISNNSGSDNYYNIYVDAFAAIQEFAIANNLLIDMVRTTLTDNENENINIIRQSIRIISERLNSMAAKNVLETARNRFKTYFENSFSYKFTESDLKRIQTLINKLRDSINESPMFEGNHKTRLLLKLEKLQSELHKKMSDIDKIWSLFGEAGVILGKFGTDAKPFIDMIQEIIQIGMRTQAIAEELPSSTTIPMLNE